ncbi:MAG: alpha-amylase family glycosyl hydrolase [bacterium]
MSHRQSSDNVTIDKIKASARPQRALPWWQGAVIYQIYPRSFLDTNNDGVGDLRGIIKGLPYVASLNVDAVWLSPFFTSPMKDFGYDISDYYDIDPLFGNLTDFDDLIETAHKLELKIIIDQVYSHTSDQHAWFKESRKDRTNPKADWYVWSDPKPDGSPPNNWQSVFGGGSWEWDNTRRQYYLHNFLTTQPDLNLHNPDVQDALLNVSRFWLDRGVDGFRLDAINFGMHDPQLRDNPPIRVFDKAPTRPFDFQDHCFSQSHPDIVKFLERIRSVLDEYDNKFTVAEVGGRDPLAEMKLFTQGQSRLNSAYSFNYLYADTITGTYIKDTSQDWPGKENEGWPSWAFSNHDAPRAISRWGDPSELDKSARLYALILLSLRGNAFLYQGEELGLEQATIPFEQLQDPEAIANWPATLGRDGARTPMPWDATEDHAGFSKARPWLPIDRNHFGKAIKQQEEQEDSLLHYMRHLIALRKSSKALTIGDILFLDASQNKLIFTRCHTKEELFCAFNLGKTEIEWQPHYPDQWELVCTTQDTSQHSTMGNNLPKGLGPYVGYIAKRR